MTRHPNSPGRKLGEILAKLDPDTPLRLKIAAELAYPDGSMTASGLRREAERGRLEIERTAGKDYTTLAAIKRMRDLCRVETKGLGCGSAKRSTMPSEGSLT